MNWKSHCRPCWSQYLSSSKATNYKMASAMPDPCHAENLQGSQRRPEPAEIARDRSLQKTKGKYNIRGTSDTKNVSLHDRILKSVSWSAPDRQRNENFLWCLQRRILSSKKSVIKLHCTSQKHVRSKERSRKSKLKGQTIAEALSRKKTRQDSTLPLASIQTRSSGEISKGRDSHQQNRQAAFSAREKRPSLYQ